MNRIIGQVIKSKTIPQGAATTVWARVAPKAGTPTVRGAYLVDCGPGVPTELGRDEKKELRQKLWIATEEQLNAAVQKAGLNDS